MLREDNGKLLANLERHREKARRKKDERIVTKEEFEEQGKIMMDLEDNIIHVRQENELCQIR